MVRGDVHLSLLRDLNERNPASELEQTIKEREVALDKELLQLVQSACKADSLQRALDLARLMHNAATVDAAAKVAAFYHLPGLQERIQGVKIDKEMMRVKEKRARRDAIAPASSSKVFADFVPRNGGPRRSFGGVQRDSTPAASGRSETYVPETPGEAYPTEDGGSPEGKRLRLEETPVAEPEEFTPLPRKHTEDLPISNGYSSGDRLVPTDTLIMGAGTAKNPFAKKTVPGSNPFAKQATVRPLDALKSTSFFERVDNIELSGAPKGGSTIHHQDQVPV